MSGRRPAAGPVLVTGGAGSLGREVAERLYCSGRRVRVLDRPDRDYSWVEALPGAEVVRGDIADRDLLRAAVAGVEASVHLAALLPPASERDPDLTRRVNVEGTARLVRALHAERPDARIVFASSVCVYGDTAGEPPPVAVDHPVRPQDLYGWSKVEGERIVRASGLPTAIVRISGVFVPAFLAPPDVWPFAADQRVEFVFRSDVAAALVACLDEPRAFGRTLHVAGGETWRMHGAEYAAATGDILGLEPADARYLDAPGSFDWYDTVEAQAILSYQRTPFPRALDLLRQAVEAALGG